jgi:hypothetical protein
VTESGRAFARSPSGHESRFNIVFSSYLFARRTFYDIGYETARPEGARDDRITPAEKAQRMEKTDGNREGAKPPGHFSQSREEVQDLGHDFSRQWSKIAGFRYMVR